VVALAIDALLPALDIIGITIGTTEVVDNQLLITMIFSGLGFGPLVSVPSDSFGRKPVVYMGFALFIAGQFRLCKRNKFRSNGYRKDLARNRPFCSRTMSIAIIRYVQRRL
jgi:DHA1 family bicyclomycin/chloramphenicol resistance-like MFS transporter